MAENEEHLFVDELQTLINKHGLERQSNTPDFILAEYLMDCLQNFNRAISARNRWYAAEHNAHLTPESLASSQAVVNTSALEQSDGDSSPTQAQVAQTVRRNYEVV